MATKLRDLPRQVGIATVSTGHTIEVRALSLNELMTLLGDHGGTMSTLFGGLIAKAQAKELTMDHVNAAATGLIMEAPQLVARMIAMANDDFTPEGVEAAEHLPAIDQLELLTVAAKETFKSEATVKKLAASLTEVFQILSGALGTIPKKDKSLSRIGIGASVGKRA